MKANLSRGRSEEYLVRLVFGSKGSYLKRSLRRSYRDFNRTLHGISAEKEIYDSAVEVLIQRFDVIKSTKSPTQSQFDRWHRATCKALADTYEQSGYRKFYLGQAQKWVNMTFKYIFVLGRRRVGGFDHLYQYCHMPLDNILLKALKNYQFEDLPCAWSRLDDYDIYLSRQKWLRSRFARLPLDVEFQLWLATPQSMSD